VFQQLLGYISLLCNAVEVPRKEMQTIETEIRIK
jgi:hypothetical protein